MTTTKQAAKTTGRSAARVSRLRVLALAERERFRNGWTFVGDRIAQRCPCCAATVRAVAPEPPQDPGRFDRYKRQINNLLNDAVLDHMRHECDTPDEGWRA
jgi:hypothetical protein